MPHVSKPEKANLHRPCPYPRRVTRPNAACHRRQVSGPDQTRLTSITAKSVMPHMNNVICELSPIRLNPLEIV
jgi:hypothetical protein